MIRATEARFLQLGGLGTCGYGFALRSMSDDLSCWASPGIDSSRLMLSALGVALADSSLFRTPTSNNDNFVPRMMRLGSRLLGDDAASNVQLLIGSSS